MIPLSDIDRRPLSFPVITTLIISTNVIVFLLELILGNPFVMRWSVIPSQIASGRNLVTIITSMFLHGGILHIAGNMIYLWAFGPEMEDVMGGFFYLALYFSGGIIASIAQVTIAPASSIPNLGASGAIAAVMGAFLIRFPHDRIRTVVFLGWFVTISFIPSIILIGFWFIIQVFFQLGSIAKTQAGGGVAYMAHIGGFVFGMAFEYFFKILRPHSPDSDRT